MAVSSTMTSGEKVEKRLIRDEFDYDAVLLDIEGTTTPISFVKDVLFPYAKDNVQGFLERTWETVQCKEDVMALKRQANEDKDMEGVVLIPEEDSLSQNNTEASKEIIINAVVENVIWQMSSDRKTTALKQLQGHIWKEAFCDGKIKGEVFDDILPALKQWASEKIKVYIYSSGSVDAQKLLFGNSTFGDLLQYINGHFDTTVGAKTESGSYKKIAEAVDVKSSRILFVTDVISEARAAFEAGYTTAVSVRPGNAALTDMDKKDFTTISTFNELFEETEERPHRTKKSKEDDC
ncbi:hypothetical protein ACROYT_G040529 [Oculina patagonica]